MTARFSPGRLAQSACVLEATAAKAGNVHPDASFEDAHWQDFMVSAIVTAPLLDQVAEFGVGHTILQCVRATQDAVGHNTNLGMLLLLAPLTAAAHRASASESPAAAPPVPTTSSTSATSPASLADHLAAVLADLTSEDAAAAFTAIAEASPAGLGQTDRGDVHAPPPADLSLVDAMRLAADRDDVAKQYATNFADIFDRLTPQLAAHLAAGMPTDLAIVTLHLQQMAHTPDTLIRRKCGDAEATESQRRAQHVLDAGFPRTDAGAEAMNDFDAWLRESPNHQRNPGASADLIAATIFCAMHAGVIPSEGTPWSASLPG